jgi:hypothetical protein
MEEMMKKTALLMALAMLVVASPALAAFTNTDLILTVYNKLDKEVGLDLGLDLTTYNFAAAVNDKVLTGGWSLADFGVSLTQLSAAVYGMTPPTDPDYYNVNLFFATTKPTAPGLGQSSYVSFMGGFGNVTLTYNTYGTGGKYIQNANKPGSYVYAMNGAGTNPGAYTGLNLDPLDGEAKMAAPFVDMYLYKVFAGIDEDTEADFVNLVPGLGHDYQAVVRLFANGDVVINPQAVPVPATVWLLGSGLIGLVGIRRRNA